MMKTLNLILSISALMSHTSTLLCGLWIRGQGAGLDLSSIQFHLSLGLISILLAGTALTVALII